MRDERPIKNLFNVVDTFSGFSGLKPNLSKCEIAGIGALKGVKKAICGIKCIDLTNEVIKILGIFYSYDKKIELETNFHKVIIDIERVLRMWRVRNLTLECKIIIFKTLALSKIVFLAQILPVPPETIKTLNCIQKDFLWSSRTVKIKNDTLCNDFQDGGLKNVDIGTKIVSLQCAWIRRLYDQSFHDWKVIPLKLINN